MAVINLLYFNLIKLTENTALDSRGPKKQTKIINHQSEMNIL